MERKGKPYDRHCGKRLCSDTVESLYIHRLESFGSIETDCSCEQWVASSKKQEHIIVEPTLRLIPSRSSVIGDVVIDQQRATGGSSPLPVVPSSCLLCSDHPLAALSRHRVYHVFGPALIDVSCSIPAPGRNMPRREQKGVSRHTNEKRGQKRLARHARGRDPKLKRQLDSLLSGCIFRFVRKRISSCGCFVARFDLVHMDPTRLHTLSIMFSQSVPHLAEREPRTRQSSIRRGKKVDWWNRTPDRGTHARIRAAE